MKDLEKPAAGEGAIDGHDDDPAGERHDDADDGVLHVALGGLDGLLIAGGGEVLESRDDEGDDGDEAEDREKPVHEAHKKKPDRRLGESGILGETDTRAVHEIRGTPSAPGRRGRTATRACAGSCATIPRYATIRHPLTCTRLDIWRVVVSLTTDITTVSIRSTHRTV